MFHLSLWILVVLVALVAVIAAVLKAKLGEIGKIETSLPSVYEVRHSVLTPAERSFAGVLDGALPDDVTWLTKVRLGDIVVTRKGLTNSQRASAWNRVNQKHVDFLLVRMTDFAPLAGIELDDRSHEAEERKTRDAFVDQVFQSCSLPLLHVPAKSAYNQDDLRTRITGVLKV